MHYLTLTLSVLIGAVILIGAGGIMYGLTGAIIGSILWLVAVVGLMVIRFYECKGD